MYGAAAINGAIALYCGWNMYVAAAIDVAVALYDGGTCTSMARQLLMVP